MMLLLMRLDERREWVLAVSVSEIQPGPVPAGLESGNVMKLGVERALSAAKKSNSREGSMPLLLRFTEPSIRPGGPEYGA